MSWGADTTAAQWDALHIQPRHHLTYPSEHVVRWLSGIEWPHDDRHHACALDIGCGSGRHMNVLATFGYHVSGCDQSEAAVKWAASRWDYATQFVRVGVASALPFKDGYFDVALSYGTFYYGSKEDHRAAIAEMHRVLRPGGRALVCIRRHDDWHTRFMCNGRFYCIDEPENGMPMHFLTEYEVRTFYAAFSDITLNWTKTTRGSRCDSEWLIQLTK